MHIMFSAGQYRSTEKGYKIYFAKYLKILYILKLKFYKKFFIHFRPNPSDKEKWKKKFWTTKLFFMCAFPIGEPSKKKLTFLADISPPPPQVGLNGHMSKKKFFSCIKLVFWNKKIQKILNWGNCPVMWVCENIRILVLDNHLKLFLSRSVCTKRQ